MSSPINNQEKFSLEKIGSRLLTLGLSLAFIGFLISFIAGFQVQDGGRSFLHSYLVSLMFFLTLSLGALFFVLLQFLTRAGWSVVVRRLAEILACNVSVIALLFLPILYVMLGGNDVLYEWVNIQRVAEDKVLAAKAAYLNVQFFAVRFAVYFVIWTFLSRYFFAKSQAQDSSGDIAITSHLQKIAAPGMLLFALSITFAAFDWMMSLTPHWASTVYGVYVFSGSVIGFLCTMILLLRWLQSQGILKHSVTVEHYHDLGKLLFGFTFFWGYIAFSQFMLIWYANLPEETEWFQFRIHGPWMWVSLLLLVGHFILPFAGLLSRHVKRHPQGLTFWAIWLLVMHFVDLFWLILPHLDEDNVRFGLITLSCLLGMAGVFIANFAYTARQVSLLPTKDPRLEESLLFENL